MTRSVAGVLARVVDRPAGLVAIGALLLASVAVAPGLGVLFAWPLLFVLPGWILVGRVAPTLTGAGRLGVAVVTSVYLSAHLTNALGALAGHYDRGVVLGAVAILAAGSGIAAWHWWRVPLNASFTPARIPELPVAAFAVAGTAVAWVGIVLGLSAWHLTPSGWVSGGWNWSDLLVHVSIAESINAGNFPPQVPYFAGASLTYHWFADFHAALSALVAGLGTIRVMVVTNALMAGVLALLVWELAWTLLRDRRAAAIAAVVAVFAGGMGYLRLPVDWSALPPDRQTLAGLIDLISNTPYDNRWLTQWPYFNIASVMGTGLLTHRATTLGLPGLVAVVVLVAVSLGKRPAGMWLAGLLAALLAPFHFFAFPAVYLIVLLQVVAARFWRRPGWPADAVRFLLPAVLAIPFVLPAFTQASEANRLRLVIGWHEAPYKDGLAGEIFFYLTNLGVPFVLALVAALRRDLPHRAFLVAWAAAMFAVPNLAVFTAVEFDMNKYFQFTWIAVALLAAWLVRRWARVPLAAFAVLSVLSPFLVSLWFLQSSWVTLTVPQERASGWIRDNVPERAVFVTEAAINSPVDLAGRLRLTSFWAYIANLGYDPAPRETAVKEVQCGGDQRAAEVMHRYGAAYVLETTTPACAGGSPTDFARSPLFEPLYADAEVRIWHLRS